MSSDYTPDQSQDVEVILDIRRVARELGHPPRRSEYNEHGRWSRGTAERLIADRWDDVLREAGLDPADKPNDPSYIYTDDELIEYLVLWRDLVGDWPTSTDANNPETGLPAGPTYHIRLGSWSEAIELAKERRGSERGDADGK